MSSIYLMSGSYTKRGFCEDVMFILKKELKKNATLAFIPTEFENCEKNIETCNKMLNWFKDKDVIFKKAIVIDDSLSNREANKIIKECDAVFLMGGDTLKQIEGINKKKIKTSIKNSNIIIGMSAGSINLGKNVVLTKDPEDNIPETITYKGVGCVNINIEPHCDFDDEEHWKDLLEVSKISKIFCMRDNCSIIIQNGEKIILGNYCIIKNGEIISNNL